MKIRNIAAKTAAVLGCSALLALVPAIAGDHAAAGEDLGAEVSVGYDTDYIFRGANLGQDLLWSDVNVSTSLSDGLGLNIGAWYANPTDAGDDELDIYAGVSTDLGGMSLDLGTTYYYYPGATGSNTLEFGAALGTSVGAFDVSLGVYHDIDTENTYVELGAGTSFDLTDNISLDLGATIGNNQDEVVGGQSDGLTAVTITVGAPIGLTDNASLTPYLGINAGLDDNQDAGDEIFSGISLSVGF
ncbi:MAG: TorF family putative porin [Verrucomicrobiota bacterium]|nr:TorF family putative porin [Verrucomicrobiota bacterium]